MFHFFTSFFTFFCYHYHQDPGARRHQGPLGGRHPATRSSQTLDGTFKTETTRYISLTHPFYQ